MGACTSVTIYSRDGVETHQYLGAVVITAKSDASPLYARTEGAGLVVGAKSVTVGWLSEQMAVFPDPRQCAVMVVPADPEQMKQFAGQINAAADPCVERGAMK
jgi:hypothetical protein